MIDKDELRKAIKAYMETLIDNNIYYLKAGKNATNPYAVFRLITNSKDDHLRAVQLIIDGQSEGTSTTTLDEMLKKINGYWDDDVWIEGMDRKVLSLDYNTVIFYADSSIDIDEKDTKLNHKEITYTGTIVI